MSKKVNPEPIRLKLYKKQLKMQERNLEIRLIKEKNKEEKLKLQRERQELIERKVLLAEQRALNHAKSIKKAKIIINLLKEETWEALGFEDPSIVEQLTLEEASEIVYLRLLPHGVSLYEVKKIIFFINEKHRHKYINSIRFIKGNYCLRGTKLEEPKDLK